MEPNQNKLRWILIGIACVLVLCAGSFFGGCSCGKESGYASGYKQASKDATCDGGTHYRPFPDPK